MGLGDELMASGYARGAANRGRLIAFGNRREIKWHANSWQIFRGNPNVVMPGMPRRNNFEWIENYTGHRPYVQWSHALRRMQFIPGTQRVGELFLERHELEFAAKVDPGFILIEPNTKGGPTSNKQWPQHWYGALAMSLRQAGYRIVQFRGQASLRAAEQVRTPDFRTACAVLQRARLYIGPEGGLHHAAATLGVPAVVIFGGFIAPSVTGYSMEDHGVKHVNLFTGENYGCGSMDQCDHCRQAMQRISVERVFNESMRLLEVSNGGVSRHDEANDFGSVGDGAGWNWSGGLREPAGESG